MTAECCLKKTWETAWVSSSLFIFTAVRLEQFFWRKQMSHQKELLDAYFNTMKPEERLARLEELEKSGAADAPYLRRLFHMRYQKTADAEEYADLLLKLWMDMWIRCKTSSGSWASKRDRKAILKEAQDLGLMELKKQEPPERDYIYEEMSHLVKLFIILCEQDKRYTHVFQGFVSIPKDQLKRKIIEDMEDIGIRFIEEHDLDEEFADMKKATGDILRDYLLQGAI